MTMMIELPGEGVSVTATCPRCHEPLATTSGSVSWACDTYGCATRIVPMWEDARFVDESDEPVTVMGAKNLVGA